MDDLAVDQIITEKKTEVAEAAKPVVAPVAEAPKPEQAAPAEDKAPEGETEDAGESESRTPWPKTAVNAMARRDRKLNQLRARDAERESKLSDASFLEQRLSELKGGNKPAAVASADPEPDITKYNDWDKYNADLRAWDRRQVAAELKGSMTETQKTEQANSQFEALATKASTKAAEVIASNPEFLDIVQQNADVIDAFPEHVQHAILNAENATLAVVVLANEGTLEDLAEMSPALAEKTLKAAQARGVALINKGEGSTMIDEAPAAPVKTVSRAPAPMKSARTVPHSGMKRAKDMNDTEFRKEFSV